MKTVVGPNYWSVLIYVLLCCLLLIGLGSFIINGKFNPPDTVTGWLAIFIVLALIIIAGFLVIKGFFFQPLKVVIDEASNSIACYSFFTKQEFNIANLKGYSIASQRSRYREFKGVVLYFKDGKIVELGGFNLSSFVPVQVYLKKMNVQYLGTEKSWFPWKPLGGFAYK